jgi:hypothetical protein
MRSRNQPCVYAISVDRTPRIYCFAIVQSVGVNRGDTSEPRLAGALDDDAPALTDPHFAALVRE